MKRFKKVLAMMLAIVMVVGVVNLPAKEAKAAENLTIGLASAHVRTKEIHNADDYLIYLTGLTSAQVSALTNKKLSHVLIDGKAITNRTLYALSDNGGHMAFTISPSKLDSTATLPSEVGRHFVTIPKGATIGDTYTVANDLTLYINGSNKPTLVEEFVSLGYDHTWDRGNDFLNYLTGFTAAELDAMGTNGMGHDFATGDVLVDGVATSEPYLWNLTGGNLGLIVNPDHLESGVTTTAGVTGDHLITLQKGTKIGKYTVDRDLKLKLSGGTMEWANPYDAEPTLSISENRTDLLMLKADEIETPLTDIHFEAVNSESTYEYNGVASQMNLFYSLYGGIYAEVTGMSGKTAPDAGDVITIKGLWRYLGDRKIYDFGITNYSWNGTEWIEGLYVDATDATLTITGVNRTDVLIVSVDQLDVPEGDVLFDAVDESSLYLYNGSPCSGKPTMSKFGGIYLDTAGMSGGKTKPDTGDTMTISGLWKYQGDGKIYDFGSNVYEWDGSKWIVYVPSNDLTLEYVTHVKRTNDWIFYLKPSFTIEETDFETGKDYKHLGNTSVIKINDGTSEVTAENAEIYAFLSGNLGFTITPTQGLPAEPTVGTTVTFPAGLKVTFRDVPYATKKAITFEYDGEKFVVKEAEPEQPEDPETPQFTLTWGTGSAQDNSQARYLIYPEGATAEQITAFHQKKATIYIDGDPVANGVTFWNDGGKLLMYVRYNKFEDGTATSASELDRHTVMLKAGTEVGGYTLSTDFVFTVAQTSIFAGSQDVIFTYRQGVAQDGATLLRYLIYLDGATVAQMTDMHTKKAVLYIDGIQTTGESHFYKLNDNDFVLLLYYNDIEAGVTKGAEIGEHTITLKKGTQIGGYYVGKTLTIGVNGTTVQLLEAESDAELDKLQLKATEGTGYEENGAYTVVATPSYYLPGVIGETVYKLTVKIGDTPYEVDATKTDMGQLKFTIPASALTDSFTLTVPTAECTSTDGTYGPLLLADYTLYVNTYGYNETGYLTSKGANVAATLASGDASGINLSATDSMTVMGTTGKTAGRVEDGLSGVYYNGELTDVGLRKSAEGTWRVDLAGRSITAVTGDSVIVTGAFAKGTEYIEFATISLTFNGSAWTVNSGVATLPQKTTNISEDSFYVVPANTVINDGAVTGSVLSKSGVYTLKTDIGGAICERQVVLYKKADINADNVMNVLDLVALKKNSLGLKELNQSGTLASDLGGADTAENLTVLRAMYLTNYTLKADEELPTDIVGQTGSGTYITDVQATEDGTAVFSVADTDNGYKVSNDTYENVGLDYVLDFNVDRDLKILQLTDPQLIDSSQMRTTDRLGSSQIEMYKPENFEANAFYYIKEAVEASNPDVIFVTGDLVYGEFDDNGSAFLALVEVMESLQIPWAPIFGNHDNESMKGVEWQCEQLMNAEYCLFNRRHSIGGNGNYSVGIAKNGSLERVMYLMDTHACWDAVDRGEAVENRVGFTDAQLDWYRASALHVSSFAGEEVPSFLCYHIPTTEVIKGGYVAGYHDITENQTTFTDAYQIGVDNVAQPGDVGRHEERFKDAYDCDGLLETMQEVGTDGAFFAHSHRNNISVKYGGVRWTFGLKTGKYDRYPTDLGGVLVTLPSDGGEFTVQQIVVEQIS